MIYMGCEPRADFNTGEHQRNAAGVLKWAVTIAVQTRPVNGQRSTAETIVVTVPSNEDPAAALMPGTPVDVLDMYTGTTDPELRNEKIRGGRQYCQGSAIVARVPVKS
jgi:hypothetical protein